MFWIHNDEVHKKMMNRICNFTILFNVLILTISMVYADHHSSPKKGVYEFVVRNISLSFEEASEAIENSTQEQPFRMISKIDMASPEKCGYRARVFVVFDSVYADELLKINPQTAPFGMMDRVNLFEDEDGLHLSIVNPANINRTILMEDEKYNTLLENHRLALREFLANTVAGESSEKPYGKIRDKGYIGRTMGVMAGGSFDGKIKTVLELNDLDLKEVTEKVASAMQTAGEKWGLTLKYSFISEGRNIAVLGTSSPAVESKSFSIVKAGGDDDRKKFSCPGVAHAAAYPIEVVIVEEGDLVKIQVLNIMYRMKMYFEDAGKWAFAKNMGMPGSIQDEIQAQIKKAFPEQN
jgi:uncharacterized protein (DUF302 family)